MEVSSSSSSAADCLDNTTTIISSSNASSNEDTIESQKKQIRINDDILHEIVALLTRAELGERFSLVNHRFHALAYRKMHIANAHWVVGDCYLNVATTGREQTAPTMVVPKGEEGGGGFEVVPVPCVPLSPNVLGFRGKMHFSGTLTATVLAFFRNALPPATTLYRFSSLDLFYKANGMLSPFQGSERFNTFLDNCVRLVELGCTNDAAFIGGRTNDAAFIGAFLAHPSVCRHVRWVRVTRFRDLFLGWLHSQREDGDWRHLRVMRRMFTRERNRLIKLVLQDLNTDNADAATVLEPSLTVPQSSSSSSSTGEISDNALSSPSSSSPSVLRFTIRLVVRNYGHNIDRLPMRWVRNTRTGQCVVFVERRTPPPINNTNVELYIVRCPCAEAEQRGLMPGTVNDTEFDLQFGWEEPVCTVDVMHRADLSYDYNVPAPAANQVNTASLHHFF